MDNKIYIVDDNVFIPDNYLQKFQYILGDKSDLLQDFNKDLKGNYIKTKVFYYYIEKIIEYYKQDSTDKYVDSIFVHFLPELKDKIKSLYGEFYALDDKVRSLDNIDYIIDLCVTFRTTERQTFLLRELIDYKEDIIKDMTEYKSQEEIEAFVSEYDKAILSRDIDKMLEMISKFHEEIQEEWKKYISDPLSISNSDFLFLGHATQNVDGWEKSVNSKSGQVKKENIFNSRFISCSLFSPESTDTIGNRRYGFIMSPNNIVGATSHDMRVNNYTDDVSTLKLCTRCVKINHPKRILKELKEEKKRNLSEDDDRGVYSEIILDGFEPIGIFCFTNGIKDFDPAYAYATRLSKCFPDLEFKVIDLFLVKKGEELRRLEVDLINRLKASFNFEFNRDVVTVHDLPRYRLFLDDFYALKSKGDVLLEHLRSPLEKNMKLISVKDFTHDNLFDGRFNHDEIKYILGNHPKYNIDYILKGDIKAHSIYNLSYLYPYKAKLNKYYPGLGLFVELINKFRLTREDIDSFIAADTYSFQNFSSIFKKNVEVRLGKEIDEKQALIESDMVTYNTLVDEKNELSLKKKKYEDSFFILSNAPWEPIILGEITDKKQEIEDLQGKYNKLDSEKRILENQLSQLMNDHNDEKDKVFMRTKDIVSLEEKIVSLDREVRVLSSNIFKQIFNRRKIKIKKDESNQAREEIARCESNFERNKKQNLSVSEFRIETVTNRLNEIESKMREYGYTIRRDKDLIQEATKTLLEYFKVDSLDRIDDAINEAKRYINEEYDSSTDTRLTIIEAQIDALARKIAQQSNEIITLEQEIKGMSL